MTSMSSGTTSVPFVAASTNSASDASSRMSPLLPLERAACSRSISARISGYFDPVPCAAVMLSRNDCAVACSSAVSGANTPRCTWNSRTVAWCRSTDARSAPPSVVGTRAGGLSFCSAAWCADHSAGAAAFTLRTTVHDGGAARSALHDSDQRNRPGAVSLTISKNVFVVGGVCTSQIRLWTRAHARPEGWRNVAMYVFACCTSSSTTCQIGARKPSDVSWWIGIASRCTTTPGTLDASTSNGASDSTQGSSLGLEIRTRNSLSIAAGTTLAGLPHQYSRSVTRRLSIR
jgi:hypothetical protein